MGEGKDLALCGNLAICQAASGQQKAVQAPTQIKAQVEVRVQTKAQAQQKGCRFSYPSSLSSFVRWGLKN
jgi:hypothetical protein